MSNVEKTTTNLNNNYDISILNRLLPSRQALYDMLMDKQGFYLPSLKKSKANTEEYLLLVAKGSVFTIKLDKVKIGKTNRTVFKSDLWAILKTLSKIPLGFTENHLPDKEWFINVIYTLDPGNEIFKIPIAGLFREIPST